MFLADMDHGPKLRGVSDSAADIITRINDPIHGFDGALWSSLGNRSSAPSFEVSSCPDLPGQTYPTEWPILDVIRNWNPDDTVMC